MEARDEGCVDGGGERSAADVVRYRNPFSVQASAFAGVVLGMTALTLVLRPFYTQHLGRRQVETPLWFAVWTGVVLGVMSGGLLLAASRRRRLLSSSLLCWMCAFAGVVVGGFLLDGTPVLPAAVLGWFVGCCWISGLLRSESSRSTRCEECGYDAVGLAVCPECGWKTGVGRRPPALLTGGQRLRTIVWLWVVPGLLVVWAAGVLRRG